MSDERYVVVTAISQHRMRYCVPVSELQKLNTDIDIANNPKMQVEWANDCVTMEDVEEFSQHYIGEQIIDTFIVDEERMLLMFDRDNDYLANWPREQKIDKVHNWKASWKKGK